MASSRHLAFRPRSPLFLPTNVQPPWYCELQKAFESSSRSRRLGQPPVDYSSMLTVAVMLWHVAVNLARGGLYKRCVSFVFTPHSSLSIPPHCELPPSFILLQFTDGPYILWDFSCSPVLPDGQLVQCTHRSPLHVSFF